MKLTTKEHNKELEEAIKWDRDFYRLEGYSQANQEMLKYCKRMCYCKNRQGTFIGDNQHKESVCCYCDMKRILMEKK